MQFQHVSVCIQHILFSYGHSLISISVLNFCKAFTVTIAKVPSVEKFVLFLTSLKYAFYTLDLHCWCRSFVICFAFCLMMDKSMLTSMNRFFFSDTACSEWIPIIAHPSNITEDKKFSLRNSSCTGGALSMPGYYQDLLLAKQIVFAKISKYVLSLGESTENYVSLHCY